MNAAEVTAALGLPSGARVARRVPKTLLVEHGAPTTADKRRIQNGIEDVEWLAVLKPNTIGVPTYVDEVREYLEIAVVSASLRPDAKVGRICELIHRAVPYPVFLIAVEGSRTILSLAHKRKSQGSADATVLDGELISVALAQNGADGFEVNLRDALALPLQPRANLYNLYQGWIDTLHALHAARITGTFTVAPSPAQAAARRNASEECKRLDAEIERLRSAAKKERQMAKQVELNLELKRAEAARANAFKNL